MLIEDPALRELFKSESEEHLQRLDDLLMRLEQMPADHGLIDESFREAHSMKGAARMLGLKAILALANRLESSLNSARQGQLSLGRDDISRMLREVEDIRRHVEEATGEPMSAATRLTPTVAAPTPTTLSNTAPQKASPPSRPASPPAPTHDVGPSRIDTVRVDTRKLDELMNHAGELVVARTRLVQRLSEIDAVIDAFEGALRGLPGVFTNPLGNVLQSLQHLRGIFAEDGTRVETLSNTLENAVRQMRLLPLATILKAFPRMVRDIGQEQGKDIELHFEGEDTLVDKRILEEIKDPLVHMLRNAADHGIESPEERRLAGKPAVGRLFIRARRCADHIVIEVGDDGKGLDLENIRTTARQRGLLTADVLDSMNDEELRALILLPGFSTKRFVTDVSGRGVGMDVVRANIEQLKGTLGIDSHAGRGTSFTMRIPVTLATMRALLVEVGGYVYGIPIENVGNSRMVARAGIFTREGRKVALFRGSPVPVAHLVDLLRLPAPPEPESRAADAAPESCVFLVVGKECFGVFVDALLGEQHLLLKPKSDLLDGVANVMGAAILSNGDICTILEPRGLLAAMPSDSRPVPRAQRQARDGGRKKLILLAEDSITTRAQEVRILEGAGYEVVAATDGLDAYGKLGSRHFDAVVSDINMPRLDGLELAGKIRAIPEYADLPIILVTSLASDEDKRRGLEVGANAYITKPEFDQTILLDCLERLVG